MHEYSFSCRPEEGIRSPGLEVVVSSLMKCVLGTTLESSERWEYALVSFILMYFYYSVLSPFFNSLKLFFIVLVTSFGFSKFTKELTIGVYPHQPILFWTCTVWLVADWPLYYLAVLNSTILGVYLTNIVARGLKLAIPWLSKKVMGSIVVPGNGHVQNLKFVIYWMLTASTVLWCLNPHSIVYHLMFILPSTTLNS